MRWSWPTGAVVPKTNKQNLINFTYLMKVYIQQYLLLQTNSTAYQSVTEMSCAKKVQYHRTSHAFQICTALYSMINFILFTLCNIISNLQQSTDKMDTISHLYIHYYIKEVELLHVLNLIGSSSGSTSNSFSCMFLYTLYKIRYRDRASAT